MRWSLLPMTLLLACGDPTSATVVGGENNPGKDAGHHRDDDSDAGSSDSTDDDDGMDEPSDSQADCSDEARWIYLVDKNNALLRFEPDANKITEVGTLRCTSDASPFSMAVSRDAVAYVLYNNGSLYEVSTDDASCKPTKFETSDPDFKTFGMGFVSDSAGGSDETLFIVSGSGGDTSALASLDTSTWNIKKRGTVTSGGELTGNGNGELWGFFPQDSPMMVRQTNKSSGATLREFDVSSIDTNFLQSPTAWAFAFWGGRYYMFYQGSGGLSGTPTTSIFRLTPETKKVETVKMSTGYTIVGAGVSTCAPVVLL